LRFAVLPGFEAKAFRRRVHGRYAIIYTVEDDLVLVPRILSTAIDLERALGSD
jgi:toxin ParE1/3/4